MNSQVVNTIIALCMIFGSVFCLFMMGRGISKGPYERLAREKAGKLNFQDKVDDFFDWLMFAKR